MQSGIVAQKCCLFSRQSPTDSHVWLAVCSESRRYQIIFAHLLHRLHVVWSSFSPQTVIFRGKPVFRAQEGRRAGERKKPGKKWKWEQVVKQCEKREGEKRPTPAHETQPGSSITFLQSSADWAAPTGGIQSTTLNYTADSVTVWVRWLLYGCFFFLDALCGFLNCVC